MRSIFVSGGWKDFFDKLKPEVKEFCLRRDCSRVHHPRSVVQNHMHFALQCSNSFVRRDAATMLFSFHSSYPVHFFKKCFCASAIFLIRSSFFFLSSEVKSLVFFLFKNKTFR